MLFILTVIVVFIFLFLNEIWWRKSRTHSELHRKFIHIVIGSFVAFWPFFLSWRQIELLSISFVVVISISKYLNIFKAIHSVQRPTWGETYFALSVGLVVLATHNKWIYMAALLQMSLADGLAAVIGESYGRRNRYMLLKHTKSIIGTLTFFITSLVILLVYSHFSHDNLSLMYISGLSILASVLENISLQGLDNLTVPIVVALFLAHQ